MKWEVWVFTQKGHNVFIESFKNEKDARKQAQKWLKDGWIPVPTTESNIEFYSPLPSYSIELVYIQEEGNVPGKFNVLEN